MWMNQKIKKIDYEQKLRKYSIVWVKLSEEVESKTRTQAAKQTSLIQTVVLSPSKERKNEYEIVNETEVTDPPRTNKYEATI